MNKDQLIGQVRHIVGVILAYCIGKGYIDNGLGEIISSIVIAGIMYHSYKTKSTEVPVEIKSPNTPTNP